MKRRSLLAGAVAVVVTLAIVAWWLRREGPSPYQTARSVPKDSTCYRAYERFYARDTIQIVVAFGYKDARPARFVGDRYEKLMFMRSLLADCPPFEVACEFRQDAEDIDLFTREIPGPDGKPRQVRLRVLHTAVGPDDDENREDSFQAWHSQYAERRFLEGISAADAVFYNGHSRAGGGPDFEPPRLNASRGVAYGWYGQEKPGLSRVLAALEGAPSPVKLLGLFSCVSTKHFAKAILSKSKDTAMLGSGELIYYADAMKNLRGALSALLGLRCEADFDSAISAESVGGKNRLEAFFEPKS